MAKQLVPGVLCPICKTVFPRGEWHICQGAAPLSMEGTTADESELALVKRIAAESLASALRHERELGEEIDRLRSRVSSLERALASADLRANRWESVAKDLDAEMIARSPSDQGDEHFDEDAQMCVCGHVSRSHAERAFNYACCKPDCKCTGFQGKK